MDKNGQNSIYEQRTTGDGQRLASDVNYISKGKHSAAVWAMDLYQRFGLAGNLHIRRLHYRALLQAGLTLPTGRAYRNTQADFEYLKMAFEQARLLGLIPYDVFSDASRFSDFGFSERAGLYGCENARRQLLKQMIEQACRRHVRNMLARIARVHVEIWLERTTAADIVSPIADKYHLNIVASHGEISLTDIWRFVRRVSRVSKPVRILYISDFDPLTASAAAINKLTAAMSQYGLSRKVDLKILQLALSKDECEKYDLPPMPGRRTLTANPTELHALEVAAPGFLCETLEKQIIHYSDSRLFTDSAKQTDDSINRLIVEINRTIDKNTDIHKCLDEIQFSVSGN
jgi:hypothetical protein